MEEPRQYLHKEAVARRDAALGRALEQSLDAHQPFNVYHLKGMYKVGPENESLAAMARGWLFVATVSG